MFKLHRILLAGALLAMATTSSMAAGLAAGSLQGTASAATLNSNHLTTASQFTVAPPNSYNLNTGTGSLALVSGASETPVVLDLNLPITSYVLTRIADGFKFEALTKISDTITGFGPITPDVGGRSIILQGLVTLGLKSNLGYLQINFSQSGFLAGGAPNVSSSLTLSVPPAVPEPSSVALAGIGLAAAGLFGLRKRLAK